MTEELKIGEEIGEVCNRNESRKGSMMAKRTVHEYRDLVSHLECLVRVDYHACVDDNERVLWAGRAARIGSELLTVECPRATDLLRRRASRVITRSSVKIFEVTSNV